MSADSPFTEPLMQCPDCGATFRANEPHDIYCGFPGHGPITRWWKRRLRGHKAEQFAAAAATEHDPDAAR